MCPFCSYGRRDAYSLHKNVDTSAGHINLLVRHSRNRAAAGHNITCILPTVLETHNSRITGRRYHLSAGPCSTPHPPECRSSGELPGSLGELRRRHPARHRPSGASRAACPLSSSCCCSAPTWDSAPLPSPPGRAGVSWTPPTSASSRSPPSASATCFLAGSILQLCFAMIKTDQRWIVVSTNISFEH